MQWGDGSTLNITCKSNGPITHLKTLEDGPERFTNLVRAVMNNLNQFFDHEINAGQRGILHALNLFTDNCFECQIRSEQTRATTKAVILSIFNNLSEHYIEYD